MSQTPPLDVPMHHLVIAHMGFPKCRVESKSGEAHVSLFKIADGWLGLEQKVLFFQAVTSFGLIT